MVSVAVRDVYFSKPFGRDGGFDPGDEIVGLCDCDRRVDENGFFGAVN